MSTKTPIAPATVTLAAMPGPGGRTIDTSVSGPVVLAPTDTPLTVTPTGRVTASGTGADGIDGAAGTTWTIANSGTVTSAAAYGVRLAGPGHITNAGFILGRDGVGLMAGGSVTIAAGGSIASTGTLGGGPSTGAGVFITGAAGTVANAGTVSGVAYGVALGAGGSVTNTSAILGGEDGVIIQGGVGDLQNAGRIVASVDDGVGVFAGGAVTNLAGASIQGGGTAGAGVFITGGTGTLDNSGSINGPKIGFLIADGGSASNAASGTIAGDVAGAFFSNVAGSLSNAGSISASSGAGADLEAGGSVSNAAGGSVTGKLFGVFITGATGTVSNSGVLAGSTYDGVELGRGGSVTNASGASITGGSSGVYLGGSGTVANFGSIHGTSAGVDLAGGGSFTNDAGGSVSGGTGVFTSAQAATVVNYGSIAGIINVGVDLGAGGSLTNAASASVSGSVSGVFTSGASASIANYGSITGMTGAGADIEAGGSVANAAGATISGSKFGVFVTHGTGTVANAGSIAGSNIGVDLVAGGTVANAAGASISSAGFGVAVYGGSGTVTNAGTISGGVASVHFGNTGADLLVVDPGAVFVGAAVGGSGSNVLELAGGGAGTIGGIGGTGQFQNFGTVHVDAGANWTLTGTNSVSALRDEGTLAVAGSLAVSGSIEVGGGSFLELGAATSATVNVVAGLPGPAVCYLDQTAFGGTIAIAAGGTLDLFLASGQAASAATISGSVLNIVTGAGIETIALGGSGYSSTFIARSGSGRAEIVLDPQCLARGTRVATSVGLVQVEDLSIGDLVVTKSAEHRPIVWIGRRRLDCSRHPEPAKVRPVRIEAGAFGPGLPARDLYVSPQHAIFDEGVLIPARLLVNGSTVTQEAVGEIEYFHIELEHHDLILAEGLPVETYLDTGDRAAFENGGGAMILHPDFSRWAWDGRACAELKVTGPEVEAVRSKLAERSSAATLRRRARPN